MTNRIRIKDLAISETGFVFDPFSGGTFTANATGQAVIKALREGQSEDELIARLRAEFEAAGPSVSDDVREFLHTLERFGLLAD